jgi:catechol 2,3-dioxygenase-like lactoylglutathione lyase family enzyme
MTETPRADLVGLIVRDMARSMAFYRRLGVEFTLGTETDDHAEASLPGGIRFALDTEASVGSFYPGWKPPTGSHRAAIAFLCGDPADVDRRYAELVANGAKGEVPPFDAPWGQRYAILTDPDGNGVDLFAPLSPPVG